MKSAVIEKERHKCSMFYCRILMMGRDLKRKLQLYLNKNIKKNRSDVED